MNKPFILACLAIVLFQHQANGNQFGKEGHQNTQAPQEKASTPPPSQAPTNPTDQKPSGNANKNQQTVSITSIPTIAVKSEKDFQDWTMVICTTILTIVGIVGTCAAIKTLRAINRQAHYMLVHARHFDKLAKAALANSQASASQLTEMEKAREIQAKTLILQYRPKVIARYAKAYDYNVAELGQAAKATVRFNLVNIGGSPAHIVGGNVALWSAEGSRSPHSSRVEVYEGIDTPMQKFTLRPGEERICEEGVLNASVTNDIQWANYHQGIATERSKAIFLVGSIWYRDDLNIPRKTGIYRKYDPKTGGFEANGQSEGEYSD